MAITEVARESPVHCDMSRGSAVIDQSGKWAPAGEILTAASSSKATAVGSNSSLPANTAGRSDQTNATNTGNGSILGSNTDINAPPVPPLPFVLPPIPPNPISNSNALPTTHSTGSSIPLRVAPVHRTSQSPQPSSGTNPSPQSNHIRSATTPRTSLHPPRQEYYGSTAPTPYIGGPMLANSYQPYQHTSSSAPHMTASPAAMSSYGPPSPTNSYQPSDPYPPPHSQRPSTSPAQTQYYPPASQSIYGTPQTPASQSMYAYSPVPQQATNLPAAHTPGPQTMYGTSQAYGSSAQPSSVWPQPYGGPATPGTPFLPYSSPAQQPVVVSGPDTPPRKRTGAFVANNPFRRHSSSKHDGPSDNLTFDDIPVAGTTVQYDPSSSAMPTPQSYSQPTRGSVFASPASYPINSGQQNQSQPQSTVSWRPDQPSPYEPSPSNTTNLPQIYPGSPPYAPIYSHHSGATPSQSNATNPPQMYTGSPPYAPVYNHYSSVTPSPMPYDDSSQYPPYPQDPLQQMVPLPLEDATGQWTSSPATTNQPSMQLPNTVAATTPLTGPLPASSSDTNLNHQPTQPTLEPISETPPRRDDGERPHSPITRPSPVYHPPGAYSPPTFGYPRPYDPNDPSAFPSPPTFPPHDPYYPATDSPLGMPTPKQSIWSRVGEVFHWPFSRRRHDEYLEPNDPYPYTPTLSESSEESKSGYPFLDVGLILKTMPREVGFILKTMPREVYLYFSLRLPSLYFSRVARIFEEADLTLPEIKKMALETASQGMNTQFDIQVFESKNVPPEYERLKSTWEAFIDSVMREWKTFNIISVLLLSAILTILQIQSAAEDPLTRYFAIFSLICSIISLLFGCMYIIRFGSMRKTYKAAEWAMEAQKNKTFIWWNVWILLAMPLVWLTWSIMLYIACIMSFVWRTSAQDANPPGDLSKGALLTVRIVITIVLAIGVLYGWLILSTFRRYGEAMDNAWKQRIDGWLEEKSVAQQHLSQSIVPYMPHPHFDPAHQTQPQFSQYPGYSEGNTPAGWFDNPQQFQPYGDSRDLTVGYPGPHFGPPYANAGYAPRPGPYDAYRDDAEQEGHVRFRSPLTSIISPQGSFIFTDSDQEAQEPLLLTGAEASSSSFKAKAKHGDSGRKTQSLPALPWPENSAGDAKSFGKLLANILQPQQNIPAD